jgi:endo-1,4-beta-xylanase
MTSAIRILGATLLLGSLTLAGAPPERPALKDAFKDAFVIGTAVNHAIVSGKDAASRDLVLQHFASITAENVLKAGPLNPKPGVWNFGPADAFVDFGEFG